MWSTVHFQLSAEIARQLTLKLSEKYVALTNERFTARVPGESAVAIEAIYPDAAVSRTGKRVHEAAIITTTPPPLRLQTVMLEREPQITVEIRDVANRKLVTAIEVLSPTNKQSRGYIEYITKRDGILRSDAHLVEIDLLRNGQRVPMREPLPPTPYFVFVSRANERPTIDAWPIRLDQPLPAFPVPLLPGDPDVTLDLQLAFTTVYDVSRYERVVDYTSPPETPLNETEARWVAEILQRAKQHS